MHLGLFGGPTRLVCAAGEKVIQRGQTPEQDRLWDTDLVLCERTGKVLIALGSLIELCEILKHSREMRLHDVSCDWAVHR